MNLPVFLALAVLLTVFQSLLASPLINNDAKVAAISSDIDCPPGIWTCKKKREVAPEQQMTINHESECPPGIWTCKKKRQSIPKPQMGIKHSDENCPPGIWTCKKKRENIPKPQMGIKHSDENCPPGIWTCKKKRENIPKPQMGIKHSDENCPPGIWTCKKKKRGANLAKKRLDMLRRWIKEKAAREAELMMNAIAKKPSKKQSDCPLGIWVC